MKADAMNETPAIRDARSAPFFDGAAKGQLMIQRCDCGRYLGPDRRECGCENPTLQWVRASGTATLVSWVVVHARATADEQGARTTVGLVELTEGPWMYARLLDTTASNLRADAPLAVDFIRPGAGESIPAFRLD
jgi:uncharacterized protein